MLFAGLYPTASTPKRSQRPACAARQAALDLDALRLMVQGLAGRVITAEGEIISLRSQLAAVRESILH
jgi:hypothetical protein